VLGVDAAATSAAHRRHRDLQSDAAGRLRDAASVPAVLRLFTADGVLIASTMPPWRRHRGVGADASTLVPTRRRRVTE